MKNKKDTRNMVIGAFIMLVLIILAGSISTNNNNSNRKEHAYECAYYQAEINSMLSQIAVLDSHPFLSWLHGDHDNNLLTKFQLDAKIEELQQKKQLCGCN